MIKKKTKPLNAQMIDMLNTAIACNDLSTIKELLSNNIDVNAAGSNGIYPVMTAVDYGNTHALISLIKRGANVNAIDKHTGYSLLMKALAKKYIPNRYLIVVLLLKNGADVNILGNDSKTALYIARTKRPAYISILKRFGATYWKNWSNQEFHYTTLIINIPVDCSEPL